MDKKVIIFFSLFSLFMIGGSLAISLWVIPKELNVGPLSKAGMIKWKSEKVVIEMEVSWILMISQMAATVGMVLLVGMQLRKWQMLNRPLSIQGYIRLISY